MTRAAFPQDVEIPTARGACLRVGVRTGKTGVPVVFVHDCRGEVHVRLATFSASAFEAAVQFASLLARGVPMRAEIRTKHSLCM